VGAWRGGAQDPGRLEQRAEIVQLRGNLGQHLARGFRRQQPFERLEMAPRELGDTVEHVRIAPEPGSQRELEQAVGHAAHRRDDHDGRQPGALARALHNPDDTRNGLGVGDGRAAELHDDGSGRRHG
jgi:hypothetical protein